jgi:sec-independent protein translocase protein TatA
MLAAIEGPDILIVLAVVLLLFGGTQIPKLARSLGSASKEFKRGQDEGQPAESSSPVVAPIVATGLDPAPVKGSPVTLVSSSADHGSGSVPPVR